MPPVPVGASASTDAHSFDHGTPSGIVRSLAGHEVTEAIERGWDKISNGELLAASEAAGLTLRGCR
jgi:hypothetical protein